MFAFCSGLYQCIPLAKPILAAGGTSGADSGRGSGHVIPVANATRLSCFSLCCPLSAEPQVQGALVAAHAVLLIHEMCLRGAASRTVGAGFVSGSSPCLYSHEDRS